MHGRYNVCDAILSIHTLSPSNGCPKLSSKQKELSLQSCWLSTHRLRTTAAKIVNDSLYIMIHKIISPCFKSQKRKQLFTSKLYYSNNFIIHNNQCLYLVLLRKNKRSSGKNSYKSVQYSRCLQLGTVSTNLFQNLSRKRNIWKFGRRPMSWRSVCPPGMP